MEETKYQIQTHALLDQKSEKPQRKNNAFIKFLQSFCIVPQRYVMGIMCLFGICNAFTMRVCLNLAITQMVNHTKATVSRFEDPHACPGEIVSSNNKIFVEKPFAIFDWDEETQGFILSGFYYGYVATQVLGGSVAERIGAKWVLGCGMFSTAVFTVLTPVVTRWGGANWLFALRLVQGVGEGPTVPALMVILSRWVPPQERAFQGALVFGGAQLGTVFGSTMSGVLLADGKDWAMVFYFFGGVTFIWCIFWSFMAYSTPNTHPYISKKELDFLNSVVKINPKNSECKDPVPWNAILRSKPMWAIVAAAVGHDWGLYTIITDLPKYSHDVLKFDIQSVGYLTALPCASLIFTSFVFGVVCDFCNNRGYHSVKTGRIIHTSIATSGPAICVVLASYAGCNGSVAMVYFVLSMALMGGFFSGMKVNTLDIAPNYAGTVTSVANSFSALTGILVPYVIGLLTPDSTLAQWRLAFWLCFGVMVATNIMYCTWADGDQQWWDDVRQHGYPAGWLKKHHPLLREDVIPKNYEKISEIEKA